MAVKSERRGSCCVLGDQGEETERDARKWEARFSREQLGAAVRDSPAPRPRSGRFDQEEVSEVTPSSAFQTVGTAPGFGPGGESQRGS